VSVIQFRFQRLSLCRTFLLHAISELVFLFLAFADQRSI
jgi:hypothetical protein